MVFYSLIVDYSDWVSMLKSKCVDGSSSGSSSQLTDSSHRRASIFSPIFTVIVSENHTSLSSMMTPVFCMECDGLWVFEFCGQFSVAIDIRNIVNYGDSDNRFVDSEYGCVCSDFGDV